MLTQAELKARYSYDPEDGVFVSLKTGFRITKVEKAGYIKICIKRKVYYAHRLAWLYMTGEFPAFHIDHRNGCKSDNRFSNLGDKTRSENQQNRGGPHKNNRLGLMGVHAYKGKFMAQIKVNRTHHYLGLHATPEAAHAAYMAAKARLHPHSPRLLGQHS